MKEKLVNYILKYIDHYSISCEVATKGCYDNGKNYVEEENLVIFLNGLKEDSDY